MGDTDLTGTLVLMAGDIGEIKGTLGALKESNAEDHEAIKQQLTGLDVRTAKLERSQRYVTGMAEFIVKHPKFVAGVTVAVLVLVGGLTVEEARNLLGGG